MRRWEYSGGWKALAILLNEACAVILVLSVVICTLYMGSSGFGWPREEGGFENTSAYENEVMEQIHRCIRAASRESKFEENGIYDADQVIDVEEYARENRAVHSDPSGGGLCYKLTDLLNWSLDGIQTISLTKITYEDGTAGYLYEEGDYTVQLVYERGAAVSSSFVYRDEQGVLEEELFFDTDAQTALGEEVIPPISGFEQTSLILSVDQIAGIEEKYTPEAYGSIIDYAEEHRLSPEELEALYQDLESALSVIYNDFYSYKENLELFSPSMTNMRYFIVPNSVEQITEKNFEQVAYTNIKKLGTEEIRDRESLLDYIRTAYSDYLIFDSSNMEFEISNMPVTLSDVSSYLKGYPPSVDGDYTLVIAVDSKYMASDNLREFKRQYDEIRPVSRMAVYGSVLGALLYLLTMVYLTVAAGRGTDDRDRSIRLNRFDRLKTEAALVVCGVPSVLLAVFGSSFLSPFMGLRDLIQYGGGLTFAINLLFLTCYLSIVRRLKSGILWKGSILFMAADAVRAMMLRRKISTRVVVTYLLFLAGNFVLLCCGAFGFLLAVSLDFAVGAVLVQRAVQRQRVLDGIEKISQGDLAYQIPLEQLGGDNRLLAEAVNQMGGGLSMAVEKSIKDERLKTDLITNVSHDIKTPLTSIINYVDLLKREEIPNERVRNYLGILEDKAQRLKHLTDDLVEASKISSGNVKLEFIRINFQELINQTNGEFSEKFEEKGLQLVLNMPKEPVIIEADGRRLWRIIENLYNNAAKYAMPRTRIYVDLTVVGHMVRFHIKNISEQPLNIEAGELTERFIRGDVARSTEGSGLGLFIAKNLTELQKGSFDIYLDGDLFKVTIIFPEAPRLEEYEEPEGLPGEEGRAAGLLTDQYLESGE